MNDFNDFRDDNQIEYDDSRRSIGVSIGILIVTLLAIGFVWLVLRGSIPGLSPDLAIATQYEDTFLFEQHARYNLLVANLGQAPSISRLTVMSTLSQTAIPETVYAPEPWSCTLQEHAVTCETSGIVAGGESLPPIEITALVSPRVSDGSAENLRFCAAVNTLLDAELDNNEICEVLTLQTAESIETATDDIATEDTVTDDTVTDDTATDETVSEPVAENAIPDDSDSITQTVETDDVVSETLEPTAPITVTSAPMADESDSITQTVESIDATEPVTETTVPMTDESGSITQTVESLETTEPVTETTAPMADESDSITQTVESDLVGSEDIGATEPLTETTAEESMAQSDMGTSDTESEIIVQVGNLDGTAMTVSVDGTVLVPIYLLPTATDAQITVATLQMQFDHTLLKPVTCNENPDQLWSIAVCNLEYGLGLLRVSVLSMEGVSEEGRAANIEFQAIGPAGTASPIQISVTNLVNRQQESVLYTIEEGAVAIE